MLLFRLCRGGDVWPAARHLTFPCSISPVCGMAGAPLTCLQAWWEVLRGLGMKIPSQRRLGFYFDVRTFVLFYYLIESVSFCCFFPNNSSQERINFWSERQHYYRSSKSGSFSACFPKAQLVHCCSAVHKPRADTAHSQAGSGFLDFSMCGYSGLAVMLTWPRGTESEAGVPVLQGVTPVVLCGWGGSCPSPAEVSAQGPLRCPGEVWNAPWLNTGDLSIVQPLCLSAGSDQGQEFGLFGDQCSSGIYKFTVPTAC